MATTNISTEIVSITGVSAHAASDEFIVSAQKFIASSIPKELLWFASAQSSAIVDANGFDVYSSDSVLAVEREGYSASEVPFSMSKWIDDSASLYKATNLYPKWYHAQGKVFIKPDPSSGGSNDGYVYYVEHTQLDDDCDLRNAVVFHASAQEFAKLASGLSVSAVPPDVPSLSTVTFSSLDSDLDASAPTFTTATVSAGGVFGANTAPAYTKVTAPSTPSLTSVTFTSVDSDLDVVKPIISTATIAASSIYTGSAPAYSKPVISLGTAPTISDLSISSVPPDVPSLATVSFTSTDSDVDAGLPSTNAYAFTALASASTYTGSAPAYSKPTISLGSAPTISRMSVNAIPPSVPSISAQSIVDPSNFAPIYTKPSLGLGAAPSISNLSISSAAPIVPLVPSFTTPSTGVTTVASTTLSNLGVPPSYTAPVVGGDATELSSLSILDGDNTIDVHADQFEFDQWFSTVAHLIEGEEDVELASAQIQKINSYIQAYSGAMQNQLNVFNDANAEYQAKLQEGIQQAQINAQKAQQQAQLDATDAQQEAALKLQKENQEYGASLQRFSAEVQGYQANVAKEVQEYQQNLEGNLRVWQAERQTDLQKYASDIQNELNEFNKQNVKYQAILQEYIQEAQLLDQNEARKIQKYQAEIQTYQAIINKEVQQYQQNLAGDIQVWQVERQTDLQEHASLIQDELNEFNKENVAYQSAIQESMQEVQLTNQKNLAAAEGELRMNMDNENRSQQRQLQNGVNDMQAVVQNNDDLIAKYSTELQQYQAEVNMEVQEYQQNLQGDLQVWQAERTTDLQKYGSDIQNELNEFNKENIAYQSAIQESMQEIQIANQVNLAQAQSDLQASTVDKDRDLQRQLQNGVNDMQVIIQNNDDLIAKYSAELQQYQSEVANKTQEATVKGQNVQFFESQASKYYAWAQDEVARYIQNNSKMINTKIAAQAQTPSQQQQQYRR